MKFAISKLLEDVTPKTLHHVQATFLSGTPRQKLDITCQPLPDMRESQIMRVFGISRNFLRRFDFE